MGCFNTTGFISRLPILHGDRVVCFIGISHNKEAENHLYNPDSLISPYFFPIRGCYDGYGSVENIDRTPIVEMIERCADQSIEQLCRSIERCIYGQTIFDNIKYWTPSLEDNEVKDDEITFYMKESEKYVKLGSFFKNRFYKEEGSEVTPILLFEHEEIYDKLFSSNNSKECLTINQLQTHIGEIEKLYKDRKGKIDKNPKLLATITDSLPWIGRDNKCFLSGFDSLSRAIRKINGKYSLSSAYPFLMVGSDNDTLSMYNKLTLQEKFTMYRECIDELRRMVVMWHFFLEAPMYISFSKTSGEQHFNLKNFMDLNNVVYNKIAEMQDAENK